MLTVRYGTDSGKDYWKVKSPWGASRGGSGYTHMEHFVGCCGIATLPSYPTGVSAVDPSPRPTLGHQMQKGSIYVHVALVLNYYVQ